MLVGAGRQAVRLAWLLGWLRWTLGQTTGLDVPQALPEEGCSLAAETGPAGAGVSIAARSMHSFLQTNRVAEAISNFTSNQVKITQKAVETLLSVPENLAPGEGQTLLGVALNQTVMSKLASAVGDWRHQGSSEGGGIVTLVIIIMVLVLFVCALMVILRSTSYGKLYEDSSGDVPKAGMHPHSGGHHAMKAKPHLGAAAHKCPRLCHELVVPLGSDCILAIKPVPPRHVEEYALDVSDLKGRPVLRALLCRTNRIAKVERAIVQSMPCPVRVPAIRLCMPEDVREEDSERRQQASDLAICNGGILENCLNMFVYDSSGSYFGALAQDRSSNRYIFQAKHYNHTLYFEGLFEEHTVCVSNDLGRIAQTEPCKMAFDPHNSYYSMRCSGAVDVGLMVCCLLAIDELENLGPRGSGVTS